MERGDVLERQSATPVSRRYGSRIGLLSARQPPVASELPPRRGRDALLRRRLPRPQSYTGGGCGRLLQRPDRGHSNPASLTPEFYSACSAVHFSRHDFHKTKLSCALFSCAIVFTIVRLTPRRSPRFLVDIRPIPVDNFNTCLNLPPAFTPPGSNPMLDFVFGRASDCSGLSRRSFLTVGGLATFGLSLPSFLRAREAVAPADRKNVNCILLWMQGGPSHIDSFDPKPDAPTEVRGEFATIPTTLPGVRFVEHLPRLARLTDDFSVIRGHDPKNGSHGVADHLMMTGHKFNASLPFPCFGSVVSKERGYKDGMLPFVQLGRFIDRRFNGGIAGFLGDEFNPFEVPDDPSRPTFTVRDLSVPEAARARLERRYAMLGEVDRHDRAEEASTPVRARDAFYEKAHGLITSPRAKRAFDFSLESDRARD